MAAAGWVDEQNPRQVDRASGAHVPRRLCAVRPLARPPHYRPREGSSVSLRQHPGQRPGDCLVVARPSALWPLGPYPLPRPSLARQAHAPAAPGDATAEPRAAEARPGAGEGTTPPSASLTFAPARERGVAAPPPPLAVSSWHGA